MVYFSLQVNWGSWTCCVFSCSPEVACRRHWKATPALCGRSTVNRSSPWSRPWWDRRQVPPALFMPCWALALMWPQPRNKTACKTKRKLIFFFFWLANVFSPFFFLVVSNNSGGRKRAKFKVWWLKKKKHHSTTATGPVLLFFSGWTHFFFNCFPTSSSSPILHSGCFKPPRDSKIMTRNGAASGEKIPKCGHVLFPLKI